MRRRVFAAVAVALLVAAGGYLLAAGDEPSGDATDEAGAPRDAAVERPPTTRPTPSLATTAASTSVVVPIATAPTDPAAPAATAPPAPVAATTTTPTAEVSMALLPSGDGNDASNFVLAYYDIVNAEDLGRGWELLAPEFQARTGFDGYTSFWNRYDVDIRSARTVGQTEGGGAVVEVAMTYVEADRRVEEVDQLTLQRTPEGTYLIALQQVVG